MSTAPTGFLEVRPAPGPTDALLVASPSKSATHRGILLGLLTPHTVLENPLLSRDTVASLRVAAALGARTSAEPVSDAGRRLLGALGGDGPAELRAVHAASHDAATEQAGVSKAWKGVALDGVLARLSPDVPKPLLAAQVRLHIEGPARVDPVVQRVDCANSGTTLRISTALAGLGQKAITLTGDASLVQRPMGPLTEALSQLGVKARCEGKDGRPPVVVQGPLSAGTARIAGDVSSQFVSALLIAAQRAPGPVEIQLFTPLKSAPYVDVTRALIVRFGGAVDVTRPTGKGGPRYRVPGNAPLRPTRYFVPGDFSSAAFPLVAAAITGGRVALAGLEPDGEQGDRAVLDVLATAGCSVDWEADAERPGGHLVTVTAPAGPLRAFTHSFRDTPDLFPPLSVLAARAAGTSRLVDAAHVRLKECDRVAAMAAGLLAVGVEVDEKPDSLAILGAPGLPVPAARINAHDDHRILMAFATLGLVGPGPLYITDPGCYHVSYPRFRLDLDALGGESRVVDAEAVRAAVGTAATPEARR